MSSILTRKNESIIVIGAGPFGLTTALKLHTRGYHNITVLGRYLPPVPDGSSVDISRIIRPDYADPFYAKLGLEALEGWNTKFSSYFHRSGLLCVTQTKDHPYMKGSKQNLNSLGLVVEECSGHTIQQKWKAVNGDVSHMEGYYNDVCGWADAKNSVESLARCCTQAGVRFISGARGTVTSLITANREVIGVRTKSTKSVYGDRIILATGPWTPCLVDVSQTSLSTGQSVGYIQLTHEEADGMRSCPILLDFTTGWFCFPPTPDTNILKMARHGYGYESPQTDAEGLSAPSLTHNNAVSSFIPKDAEEALRTGLKLFYPAFGERDFIRRRLCWYTDTATGDFIVDYHPDYQNLFLACGGSEHAFKFLPVLGRYTADAFERIASKEQQAKWIWQRNFSPTSSGDGSRGGPPRRVLSRGERARL